MALSISFHLDFLPLLIVIGIAWAIPTLLNILHIKKIPAVIVEIVAGYFVARPLFMGMPGEGIEILDFLALSGFLFLMFQSGLEIDINKIIASFPRRHLTRASLVENPLLAGFSIFLITLLISYGAAWLLGLIIPIQNKWYFSLIMVTTSVGVILPVLKNRGEIQSRYGQMLVLGAAIADILSILLFTFTAYIIRHGLQPKLFLILAIFAAFYMFYYFGVRLRHNTLVKRLIHELSHAASQIQVRGTIFLVMIFTVIAQYIGEEVMLLGAFLSGVVLSSYINKDRSLLVIKLDGMGYGFFIPIFFVMVGAQFDPSAMQGMDESLIAFIALMLLLLYAVKVFPNLLLTRMFGLRKALSAGVLMASRLSLIIAASKIGMDLQVISPGVNAVFILMAVITCLLSPVLYSQLNREDRKPTDKIIIVGGSSTGVLLARRLRLHGKTAVIIESNLKRYHEIEGKGLDVHLGDGTNPSTYLDVGLTPQSYIIVLTGSDALNYQISRMAKQVIKHEQILTKSYQRVMEERLRFLDINFLDVRRVLATTIENIVLRPTTYQALVETFDNYSIEEITITTSKYEGKKVKNVPFHHDAFLLLYKRNDIMDLPNGETILQRGDTVFAFGTPVALDDTRMKFTNVKA